MTRIALTLLLLLSRATLAQEQEPALGRNVSGPRPAAQPRTGLSPSMAIRRAEQSIADLRPHLVVEGGYYSGAFSGVVGVHCDRRTGEIYVADPKANAIEIFSEEGLPLFAFTDDERLSGPARIAVDLEDRILVLDGDRSRIKVFDYRGEFLSYLVPPGFEGTTPSFTAMLFTPEGELWVGESTTGQVAGYGKDLKLKVRFGSRGEGAEQFSNIVGIAVDDERIYVASQQGVAVQVFNRQGRFLRGWGYHDAGIHNVSLPAGIAVDAKGRILLVDTLRQEVKYFEQDGGLIGLYAGLGRAPGAVAYPTDISLDRHGRVCVADSGNLRAQVLVPIEATRAQEPRPGAHDDAGAP